MHKLLMVIILFFTYTLVFASDFTENINDTTNNINKALLITNNPTSGAIIDTALVSAGIAAWGFSQWNWGTKSFHFHDEGWFEKKSKTGGSDKTGHLYMTYLLSRVLSSRYQERGMSLEESSFWGSLSGLGVMTLLEIGDGTSPYGFSKEDLIADAVGSLLAYVVRINPKVEEFIDIRLEYWPSNATEGRDDFTTDYSNMRHLAAFKLSGFDKLKDTSLSLIEFQVGYYSRGYRSYDTVKESQHLYVGIGISLSNLADRSGINVLKNIFEFYQPGHTYVERDLWSRP